MVLCLLPNHNFSQTMSVVNPHKFPVEFSVASTNTTLFSVTPSGGTIKPQSLAEIMVRWTPPVAELPKKIKDKSEPMAGRTFRCWCPVRLNGTHTNQGIALHDGPHAPSSMHHDGL